MAKGTEEYGVFWGDSLYDYRVTKDPIIKHILYEHDSICISSKPGVGKSILAKQMLFNLTTGFSFLDTYKIPKCNNVLYLQTEGDRAETIERVNAMKLGLMVDDSKWVHMNQDGIALNTEDGIRRFINLSKAPQINYDVIIIDPLYTTVKGSLSSDEVATAWVRNVRKIKGIYNCAFIILHHESKDLYQDGHLIRKSNENVFGSVFWSAFFNNVFKFKVANGVHYLEVGKQRSGKIIDSVEMRLIEPKPLMYSNNDDMLETSTVKITTVLRNTGKPFRASNLKKDTDLSLATVYRSLGKLIKNNLVDNVEVEGESMYKWRQI